MSNIPLSVVGAAVQQRFEEIADKYFVFLQFRHLLLAFIAERLYEEALFRASIPPFSPNSCFHKGVIKGCFLIYLYNRDLNAKM